MKLIILGNGFDMASNLPTSYDQFFSIRFKKLQQTKNLVESIFTDDGLLKDIISDKVQKEELYKKIYQEYYTRISQLILLEKLSFWDLFFIIKEQDRIDDKTIEWNSIEEQIYTFVTCVEDVESVEGIEDVEDIEEIEDIEDITVAELFNFSRISKNQDIIGISLLKMYFKSQQIEFTVETVYSLLLFELKKFEESFREYIIEIMENVNGTRYSQKTYRDNLSNLLNLSEKVDIYVINFNYTSVVSQYNSDGDELTLKDISEIQRNNIDFPVISNNVHGRYDKISIFGIDQTKLDANSNEYIFSKTYRKISEQVKIKNVPLLPYKENMEIMFYGHSLAKADYSYFQSIFDIYDIYHNQVKLVFCFSVYGKSHSHDKIRHENYNRITKLLREYGSTMINKNHGNNLVHKLLLENRLEIREVSLDEVFNENELIDKMLQKENYTLNHISSLNNRNSHEILLRRSKDYGSTKDASITTWYGVNLSKLEEERYKYISFEIKEKEIITFSKDDFIKAIEENVSSEEQEKYRKRNSFDTYIIKAKEDNCFYITRLGPHLLNPIKIIMR